MAGTYGALLLPAPRDPVSQMALSWGWATLGPDVVEEPLKERLEDHDAHLNELADSESEDLLLLGRLVAWATLAALSEGAVRDGYLRQAVQACVRLEWEDCAGGALADVGEKQLQGALQ